MTCRSRPSAVLAALLLVIAGAFDLARGCTAKLTDIAAGVIDGERFTAAYRFMPAPPRAGQRLRAEISICAKGQGEAESVSVAAHMPEHGHGMNYRAEVSPVATSLYRVDGMLLHMPGTWELVIEVRSGQKPTG